MPIRWYAAEDWTHRFGFFCDQCGRRIEKEDEGVALHYEHSEGAKDGPIGFVHKGECDDVYTAVRGSEHGSTELGPFLVYLARNTEVKWRDAVITADVLTTV